MGPLVSGPVAPGEVTAVYFSEGRDPAHVVVRWKEGRPMRGHWRGIGRYTILDGDEVDATLLLADPDVELVYLAFAPVEPPEDLDPPTPDFEPEEDWLEDHDGFGFHSTRVFPGSLGQNVTVGDVEYAWLADHEDLQPGISSVGIPYEEYAYHGTSVLGILGAPLNGYGITGGVPEAELAVFYPFQVPGVYDVAAGIMAAVEVLGPGDVLLIEQQAYVDGQFCPVSVDPAVWEAIAAAVAAGIVVVEPAGNSGANLDDPSWGGVFARENDPGSILVGGVDPVDGGWYGSSYGGRMDVAGWFVDIVATSSTEAFGELQWIDGDPRQGYTASFGGTSGASAQVAAMAALVQSVAIETREVPLAPLELRAMLVQTATPQGESAFYVGGRPNLRRLLRTWFVP